MLQSMWNVAPPATWARVALAAVSLLVGFCLLSHSLVRRNGFGERWRGWLDPQGLELTVRLGLAAVLSGVALWGWELAWPGWLWLGLAGAAGVLLVMEGMARVRTRRRSGA